MSTNTTTTLSNPGKQIRDSIPRTSQGIFKLPKQRPTILQAIQASNAGRVEELIPIRCGRMSTSPFAFYRGNADIMARDLAGLPHTQLQVQAMGDCHLMNFGGFATPERNLIFDANDFDETLPAPWEWDIKRLATSFVLAARHNSMREADARQMAIDVASAYRNAIAEYAQMNTLDLWYMKFDIPGLLNNSKSEKVKTMLKTAIDKAEKSTPEKVLYKITTGVLGNFEIADQHPLVYHTIDLVKQKEMVHHFLESYLNTLQDDRRYLMSQYRIVDLALKVVGVGSVGTRCYVALMMNDKNEPLFMQVKEARNSVLEAYTGKCKYKHNGERVVQGQRLVQAASDIFLGWSTGLENRHYYLRQLRDRKIAPDVEHFDKEVLGAYAGLCGKVLARAHAKTGRGDMISGYMGKADIMDEAIGKFAVAYADQTEKDYADFLKAIKAGKLPAKKE
ncbi:uncharacterized protein (DUF2252 family) [Chitinophaga polysaccharea]|uniref:Uncharacterized protein (DUF2252 family) n=1 Tax=Chitinophaga polysaccharea TaxID=1293035 RepID=A0A561Q5Q0_9BACT|nr:DUF2252 domain-containing protein [Chitinophaga polysaccharea]TWF45673.1 uncharacterized protein (DUF2252 family) [Chitinophaga polysaccharea]